jgi:oxaloacetate decarboxylase gamma subunit
MEVNYISEGLKFMVLGMTTVFLFLVLLIFVLKLQKKLLDKFLPEKAPTPVNTAISKTTNVTAPDDQAQVIAAITAAVSEFKKRG